MQAGRVTVRDAEEADLIAITRIYNEGIVDRIATLETEERSVEERRAWLAGRDARHPVMVAEEDGTVRGWASLNPFNPRPAYRHVVDFSIYVGREARGRGVGSALMQVVIERARQLGYHKLVLAGFPFNEAGLALYRRAGFRKVGVYKEQGVLDGQWVDTIVMELLLDADPPPGETPSSSTNRL
jgi:L-amino acid N-acyltransferase YncA